MLHIHQLKYRYPGRQEPLLENVSLRLGQGALLTILGANGAGKSTLLNCMAGLIRPQSGSITLNGRDLSTLSAREIAATIAYVSQHAPQTYQYSVLDYVLLGRAAKIGVFGRPGRHDYELAEQALARLGIAHFAGKNYTRLSGGEKQLVNIAKALAQEPQLILFDEPTAALDYGNVFRTLSLVAALAEQGYTVVMTSHNPDHPMLLASRLPASQVALLNRQGSLHSGSAEDIITEAALADLYHTDLCLADVPQLRRKICAIRQL